MSKDELVKEFTEAVSSGLLDKDLSSMIDLLNRRQAAVRHAITINDFNIGDRVVFNDQTGTRYMIGQFATVVGKRQKKIAVRLDHSIGKFNKDSQIIVPTAIVDVVVA